MWNYQGEKLDKLVTLLKILCDIDNYEMDGSLDQDVFKGDEHVTEVIEKLLKEIGANCE